MSRDRKRGRVDLVIPSKRGLGFACEDDNGRTKKLVRKGFGVLVERSDRALWYTTAVEYHSDCSPSKRVSSTFRSPYARKSAETLRNARATNEGSSTARRPAKCTRARRIGY